MTSDREGNPPYKSANSWESKCAAKRKSSRRCSGKGTKRQWEWGLRSWRYMLRWGRGKRKFRGNKTKRWSVTKGKGRSLQWFFLGCPQIFLLPNTRTQLKPCLLKTFLRIISILLMVEEQLPYYWTQVILSRINLHTISAALINPFGYPVHRHRNLAVTLLCPLGL